MLLYSPQRLSHVRGLLASVARAPRPTGQPCASLQWQIHGEMAMGSIAPPHPLRDPENIFENKSGDKKLSLIPLVSLAFYIE